MSAPSIFLVLAVGALEHVYSASANTTHVKRTVLIVDGEDEENGRRAHRDASTCEASTPTPTDSNATRIV